MKNVIKKILSIAMAFVLLGTGITVTKTFSPKFDNTIVADAASKCAHNCRWYKIEGTLFKRTNIKNGIYTYEVKYCEFTKCYKCNTTIKTRVISQKSNLTTKTNLGSEKVVYGDWLDFYDKHYVPEKYTPDPDKYYNCTEGRFICSGVYSGTECTLDGKKIYTGDYDGKKYEFVFNGKWTKEVTTTAKDYKNRTITVDVYSGGSITKKSIY